MVFTLAFDSTNLFVVGDDSKRDEFIVRFVENVAKALVKTPLRGTLRSDPHVVNIACESLTVAIGLKVSEDHKNTVELGGDFFVGSTHYRPRELLDEETASYLNLKARNKANPKKAFTGFRSPKNPGTLSPQF